MKIAQTKPRTVESQKLNPAPALRFGVSANVESMAAPAWRLPGGMRLAEYALRGGFVASSLLARAERDR